MRVIRGSESWSVAVKQMQMQNVLGSNVVGSPFKIAQGCQEQMYGLETQFPAVGPIVLAIMIRYRQRYQRCSKPFIGP